MQSINYSHNNAFLGLSTLSFAILIYFLRYLLILPAFINLKATKGKYGSKKIFKYIKKGLFFNDIIVISLEGFLEFFVYGIINYKGA